MGVVRLEAPEPVAPLGAAIGRDLDRAGLADRRGEKDQRVARVAGSSSGSG